MANPEAVKIPGVQCILLDIEGTICPISFVKTTLFPYALSALPSILHTKWDDPAFTPYRDAFPAPHRDAPDAFEAHVRDLTRRDVKVAYLKNLQGWIWEVGYAEGEYATPLFGDVKGVVRGWVGEGSGRSVVIYSSGSVAAQKLLFRHVEVDEGGQGEDGKGGGEIGEKRKRDEGDDEDGEKKRKGDEGGVVDEVDKKKVQTEDLSGLISGWFDTVNAGLKTEASSYTKIAEELKLKPETILFLSDNVKEVDAAITAGMKSLLVDRPGNNPVSDEDKKRLQVIESLDEIDLIPSDDTESSV